ncbi:MAG: GNAT family N-acetyltransferase [Gammaproteobacteria bacterium]|nr:GNAT family N-acetyltransferase [Gammaproteobacteria bacterium]MCW5583939.1 GNAT family N-acetyltransferase [Gammaproteobacteria bacterium]
MTITYRKATRSDLPDIIRLLADDQIGATREKYEEPLSPAYYAAFDAINADKNNVLIVAELDNKIVGTFQITFITYLTYQGGKRALIEEVRVDKSVRGKGFGKMMMEWAIKMAKENGCHLVQLTTNKKRTRALEFYKRLGFVASHEGMKLHL